jgi:hypothetical protein
MQWQGPRCVHGPAFSPSLRPRPLAPSLHSSPLIMCLRHPYNPTGIHAGAGEAYSVAHLTTSRSQPRSRCPHNRPDPLPTPNPPHIIPQDPRMSHTLHPEPTRRPGLRFAGEGVVGTLRKDYACFSLPIVALVEPFSLRGTPWADLMPASLLKRVCDTR